MLTLRVTSFNGQALAEPIEATFAADGGTIGRGDGNLLVLPDPARHISRLHARVVFKGAAFELIDQGGNPMDVNGAPLGQGEATVLRHGDRVRIGGYAIEVIGPLPAPATAAAIATPDDPFADLLGAGRAPRAGAHVPVAPSPRAPLADPLAAFGGPSASDPLGLGLARRAGSAPSPLPPAHGDAPAAQGVPGDFDPFADPPAAQPPAPAGAAWLPDDFDLGLRGPGGTAPSLDAEFDLAAGAGHDPFAAGPLSKPVAHAGPSGPASLDPLAPWGAAPRAPSAPSVADDVPEIHAAFKPATARPERPAATPARRSDAGSDAMLSMFDDASRPRPSLVDPLGLVAAPAAARQRPPPVIVATPDVDREPPAQPLPTAHPPPAADRDELTRAFLDGLGCANLPLAPLTPEAMARIGRLLREATQGTLDLLTARALTKREVRAEATMIVSKDNNPLKFSPSAEAALIHLLAPQGQGFMAPVEAMRDAYDDLRSHQFGFMAGLRAALAGVLRRFDPGVLAQRLAHTRSILDNVLPMNRRAKRWDLYEQLYREIANEAEEDFHTLFGREFLRAYEEQVERLERRPESGSAPPV